MSPIRQEVLNYIDLLPDLQLEALKPLLALLSQKPSPVIEADLTEDEKEEIRLGREEYKKGTYVPLRNAL